MQNINNYKIKKIKKIKFKIVTNLSHAKIIYEINNDPMSRRLSVKVKKINYKNHLIWLNKNIKDQNKKIYLTVINNKIVGIIRTEKDKNNISKISWAVSKNQRRKKYGKKMLKSFVNKYPKNYIAKIKKINTPSIKMANFSGFISKSKSSEYQYYIFKK